MVAGLPDCCWPASDDALAGAVAETDSDGNPVYTADDVARAVAFAGQALRLLTGFRVGGCPVTVRPCRQAYRDRTYRDYPVSRTAPWMPVYAGGAWLNIGCGHYDGCSCAGAAQVNLMGSAYRVDRVTVDGVALPADAYQLQAGGWLVRLDGGVWPLTQNLAAPDTEPGTWSVTYMPGVPVDGAGEYVCGLLAAEYLKAAGGADCQLPPNVTQVVRQGVTLTLAVGAFPDGRTGIRLVDEFIERWNPNGLRSAPTVWSPDLRRPRPVGGPL